MTMTEQDFIDQINASPEDRNLQQVYADWLEEQGRPECEGWRWIVRQRFLPCSFLHWGWAPHVSWLRDSDRGIDDRGEISIPDHLFELLSSYHVVSEDCWADYHGYFEAFSDLSSAYTLIKSRAGEANAE